MGLSSCSTYSYDPTDFPRACEIEEFMSPSFQFAASSSASFASSSPITNNIQRRTSADHPSGDESMFPTSKIRFAWWRRRKPPEPDDPDLLLLLPPAHLVRFSLRELQAAVKNLGGNILGHTSTGRIYAGRLSDGSLVAVKRMERTAHQIQFQTELESSLAIHPNLLHLIGFCVTQSEGLLVYPYTANGNLAGFLNRLPSQRSLDWATRVRIALGAARGICYLHNHCDPKIIHQDVHAGNIFLDGNFEPLIGGFGLALLTDREETRVDVVRGTCGLIAPEYASTGVVTEQVDVFGYGVMLLELCSDPWGADLVHLATVEKTMMLEWVKLKLEVKMVESSTDPDLHNNFDAEHLVITALLCIQASPVDRPKMSVVVVGPVERWADRLQFIMEQHQTEVEQSRNRTDILTAVESSTPK